MIYTTYNDVAGPPHHGELVKDTQIPEFVDAREFNGVVEWNTSRFVAETSNPSTTLTLAANRTRRKDPCDGYKYYTGGWNITNKHYLASWKPFAIQCRTPGQHRCRIYRIYVAAALIVLALLGFLFSILGIQCLVHILVIIGWMLITITFILSGMSLLVHNVVADTCIAMDDWRQNPTADSALEDIIPKVDNEMTQQIFNVTKATTYGAVSGVNGAILNVSNADNPPVLGPPLYFNQSGPLMPVLCNPYNADLTDRQCAAGEVDFKNSTEVWRNYICEVSESGICITPGGLLLMAITGCCCQQIALFLRADNGFNQGPPYEWMTAAGDNGFNQGPPYEWMTAAGGVTLGQSVFLWI
ncbi:hypothetical protein F0562_030226 [Nyssa sinensis]|uniref:Uncharacterized protein n=1 Tax=Nyssa sinensis TaxID=561372 RepID=A0A5J5AWD1_9ASTE|nr:hypothetical protein F0562_030226 [Nyssa sinensis]